MKLIIRDFLGALKEREELDAILPDLLSELGFRVISRPQRGTTQYGVDVAAVGLDDDGERKLFLFSIKQGDLTRADWDGTPQALRASLNQILDVYIPTRVPRQYASLKVVICLCVGGVIQEQVQADVRGFIQRHTSDQVSFAEWHGDVLAEHLLNGVLREEILPKAMRASFQKAVAMVDEPDVAYRHFVRLAAAIRDAGGQTLKTRLRAARQLYVCLWILYVWARDAGNIEAAYRASEFVLLNVWEILRPVGRSRSQDVAALRRVLEQAIQLHLAIASELLEQKVFPHVGIRHGLSHTAHPQSSLDVNLSLFGLLGRIGMTGLWLHWLAGKATGEAKGLAVQAVAAFCERGLDLIDNNPALQLPITDDQATDVALFLLLWAASGLPPERPAQWLVMMVGRLDFTMRGGGRYPACFTDYRALSEHPRDRSDDYFKEATAGSTLIPVLMAWASVAAGPDPSIRLQALAADKLEHCTFQLWLPDAASETHLYLGDDSHGRALTGVPIAEGAAAVLDTIAEACRSDTAFDALSANRADLWPIVLLACRHHRLPIPPQFWIGPLTGGATQPRPAADRPQKSGHGSIEPRCI
jgi:hypothetical protein